MKTNVIAPKGSTTLGLTVCPNDEGTLIVLKDGDVENASIMLQEAAFDFSMMFLGTKAKIKHKYAFINGTESELKALIELWEQTGGISGRINTRHWLESEAPEFLTRYRDSDNEAERARFEKSLRKAGSEGVYLTFEGERIISSTVWDASGKEEDILIEHDNRDEIILDREKREAIAKAADKNGATAKVEADELADLTGR